MSVKTCRHISIQIESLTMKCIKIVLLLILLNVCESAAGPLKPVRISVNAGSGVPLMVSSVALPPSGTYGYGQEILFRVTYTGAVHVNLLAGVPSISLAIGTRRAEALYLGGSGSSSLIFIYYVKQGDVDNDGIAFFTTDIQNNAAIKDGSGNVVSAPLPALSAFSGIKVDGIIPVVTSVRLPANGLYNYGRQLNFVVQYNKSITMAPGRQPSLDVIIGSTTRKASFSSLDATTGTMTFSYFVQDGDLDMDGITLGAQIAMNGADIRDAAGNLIDPQLSNVPATSGITVNGNRPTVQISGGATKINRPFTATIVFSEAVTGFVAGLINAGNAVLSNLQTSDNITYTVLVTPVTAGPVTVYINSNAAVNAARNPNYASNTLETDYDNIPPQISSVDVPDNGYYHAGQYLDFTVHFSEDIVMSRVLSLEVTVGSTTRKAVYLSSSSTAAVFRYIVQSGDQDLDGITIGNALQLNGGSIRDISGNDALLALNNVAATSGVMVNTSIPGVTVSTPVVSPTNQPFTASITFTEAVTGFTTADIITTNATVGNMQTSDNITYTVLVTPNTDGVVSLQVPANAAVSISNSGNTASNVINTTYDATAPVITGVTLPANGYYKAGSTLHFALQLDENVTVSMLTAGTPSLKLLIGTGAKEALYTGITGGNVLHFSYTVADGDMDMDGISVGPSLLLNGAVVRDAAANNLSLHLNNMGSTAGILINTAQPSVVITTSTASRTNAPFTATLRFSEAVTGLTATAVQVTNGTGSNLQTTDQVTYTVLITPSADGTVRVTAPAGIAQNIGGNANTASNVITTIYDGTPPVIAAGQTFSIKPYSAAGTPVGSLVATDAGGTLQNWRITADNSGGAFALATNGTITVKDATVLNSHAGSTVTLQVTVSDGLNTSMPVTVTIHIAFVNKAPTLDAVTDRNICATRDVYTIPLTGASAAEPQQTYTYTVSSSASLFEELAVTNANIFRYQLKDGVTGGQATIAITIKDNGGTANGGTDTLRRTFVITVNPLPVIQISSDKGTTVSKGDMITLTASGASTYKWANADGIISGDLTAVLQAKPMANTTYEVDATDAAGCSSRATVSIAVKEDFKVDATNILTPNGDGINDTWVIRNISSYPDNEVKIFDRSGRIVYQRQNYSNDWQGTANGHPLTEGTYYYILSINNGAKTTKGFITIVREK